MQIRNLAELKRCIQPGTEIKVLSHSKHPALIGLVRVVTEVQTNAYYSVVKGQPEHPYSICNYDNIWSRVIWHFDEYGFDFSSISLSGIQPELYSVYQAAKGIAVGSRNITIDDLASPELITDEAFQLIICALLLAKYGDAILNLE